MQACGLQCSKDRRCGIDLRGRAAHSRGALVQDGVGGVVEEQARHGQALLLAAAQRLRSTGLHLIPPLAPAHATVQPI